MVRCARLTPVVMINNDAKVERKRGDGLTSYRSSDILVYAAHFHDCRMSLICCAAVIPFVQIAQ